jgi:hypothetical protein
MTATQKAKSALESLLDDTNYYDPGDVETALDSVASTLNGALLKRGRLNFNAHPSLGNVLGKLRKSGSITEDVIETYTKIKDTIDENSYPEESEIEDPSGLEENIKKLANSLIAVLDGNHTPK